MAETESHVFPPRWRDLLFMLGRLRVERGSDCRNRIHFASEVLRVIVSVMVLLWLKDFCSWSTLVSSQDSKTGRGFAFTSHRQA